MYNNPQDRSIQPKRAGGNSAAKQSEKHNQSKATQIAQGNSTGDKKPGQGFECGGNASCGGSVEAHDQSKDQGKKSVGGKMVGAAPVVDSNIQVSERRHGAGNNADGLHEKSGQAKAERVSASRRFKQ